MDDEVVSHVIVWRLGLDNDTDHKVQICNMKEFTSIYCMFYFWGRILLSDSITDQALNIH